MDCIAFLYMHTAQHKYTYEGTHHNNILAHSFREETFLDNKHGPIDITSKIFMDHIAYESVLA